MFESLRAQLDQQIAELDHELRVELPRAIAYAVGLGDLSENAEYSAALERQELVRARISQLTRRQSEISSLDLREIPRDSAGFGSEVELEDARGERQVWRLVFPEFVDLDDNMISLASPLGRAILGARPGDEVMMRAPDGEQRYSVIRVVTVHGETVSAPAAGDTPGEEEDDD